MRIAGASMPLAIRFALRIALEKLDNICSAFCDSYVPPPGGRGVAQNSRGGKHAQGRPPDLLCRVPNHARRLMRSILECGAACLSFIADKLVISGFDWKESALYSSGVSGVVWVITLLVEASAIVKILLVGAAFMVSMCTLAALAVYRFDQSCRKRTHWP